MVRRSHSPIASVAVTVVLGASSSATAMTDGKTTQGERFVTGGVAVGERDALQKRKEEFNLWVVTAAKKSGAFFADAQVKVVDKFGKTVLDTRLDGPWLLVDLKPGEYTIEASYAGQSLQKSTAIRAGELREMYFYFEVEAQAPPPG